jgi:hypothetical protein
VGACEIREASTNHFISNTAQILTSLAEAINESNNGDPLPLLEEALQLFQRCLTLQEHQQTESTIQQQGAMSEDPPSDPEEGGGSLSQPAPAQDDRWATIVEPVTNDTLVDTILAQLECLTTLASLMPPDLEKVVWVEEYSDPLLNTKLPAYLSGTGREAEAGLTRANFIGGFADTNFRSQRIDAPTYQTALTKVFDPLDLSANPEGLVDKAEAFVAYNTALGNNYPSGEHLELRWTALTTASKCLTAAVSTNTVLAKVGTNRVT